MATKLTFELLQNIIHIESGKVVLEAPNPSYKKGILSTAGKAKIRYVGGMCVAKTRKHITNMLNYNIGDPRQCIKERIAILVKQIHLLHSFELSLEERKNAHCDKTFDEVERRQNVTQGLTYVNEKCFSFFLCLNNKITTLMTVSSLEKEKAGTFENCRDMINNDDEVKFIWSQLCEGQIDIDISLNIFHLITQRYLLVCHKQFLKDTKSQLNVLKKKRHRKEIEKKTVESQSHEINMELIKKDTSNNKEISHLKLKLKCLENPKYFNSKTFTRLDLMKLCEAYKVVFSKNMKKDQLATHLREGISISQHMENQYIFEDPEQGTSNEPQKKKAKRSHIPSKGKGKGKGKSTSSNTKYFCGECDGEYFDGEDWIECDYCNTWFHRSCASLENETDWEHVQIEEVEWVCNHCT